MTPQQSHKYAALSFEIKKDIYCECGLCTQQHMTELKNNVVHVFVLLL